MVEYSNIPATESEITTSYTEGGYSEAFKHPQETANEMADNDVTVEKISNLQSTNDKAQVTSVILRKKKILKKLFLQYIKKYIANPKKYVDHPKQIRNLPSWFDDAIILFTDAELTRDQKRMIREFFEGLIQYRDQHIASGDYTPMMTEETNRQLGERSPYKFNEENLDTVTFPREKEMQQLNVMDIAKNVAAQNIKEEQQPTMEDYVESSPQDLPPNVIYTTNKQPSSGMGIVINKPVQNAFSLENFIRPLGVRQPSPQPQQSQPIIQPIQQEPIRTTPVPTGNNDISLTGFIIGGGGNRSIFPIKRPQPQFPSQTEQIPQQVQYRKVKKNVKPKLNRKQSKNTVKKILSEGISLKGLAGKTSIELKPILSQKKQTKQSVKSKLRLKSNKISLPKLSLSKPSKSSSGLDTIRNMDKVFTQVKEHSKSNFTPGKMKMEIVGNIKDQCDKAFRRNQFRVESTNMKNNYFKDVKNSFPEIKMELDTMGDIHEKNIMKKSVIGVPKVININNTTPFVVKRGSMRPKSVGITEYDFDLGSLYKLKRKKPTQLVEEEYFYEDEV